MKTLREKLYTVDKGKSKKGMCIIKYCGNNAQNKKLICSKHGHQRNKLNNPLGYAYDRIKGNAARRGHEFTITRQYFKELCEKTGYLERKGKSRMSLSLDRINPEYGYIPNNLRVISLSENSSRESDDYDHCPF